MQKDNRKAVETRKKVFNRLFDPPCFGDNIKCPVLFTEEMYRCPLYKACDEKTLKLFEKRLRGDVIWST